MSSSKSSPIKSKAKKKAAAPPPRLLYENFDRADLATLERIEQQNDFLRLELKLINWSFNNFTTTVHTNATLINLARIIEGRHGRIANLQFFRAPPHKKNELTDFTQTLSGLGFTGGALDEGHAAILFYDFKPAVVSPLLLKEPNRIMSAQQEEANREKEMEENDKKLEELLANEQGG